MVALLAGAVCACMCPGLAWFADRAGANCCECCVNWAWGLSTPDTTIPKGAALQQVPAFCQFCPPQSSPPRFPTLFCHPLKSDRARELGPSLLQPLTPSLGWLWVACWSLALSTVKLVGDGMTCGSQIFRPQVSTGEQMPDSTPIESNTNTDII